MKINSATKTSENVDQGHNDQRLAWSKPSISKTSILKNTQGGFAGANANGDDTFYVS